MNRFRVCAVAHVIDEIYSWSQLPIFIGRRAHDDIKIIIEQNFIVVR